VAPLDDSRETDERTAGRRLSEFHTQVNAARAIVPRTPGLADALARVWQRTTRFYTRFGITVFVFRGAGSIGSLNVPPPASCPAIRIRVGAGHAHIARLFE
jgi:hypothetical protein